MGMWDGTGDKPTTDLDRLEELLASLEAPCVQGDLDPVIGFGRLTVPDPVRVKAADTIRQLREIVREAGEVLGSIETQWTYYDDTTLKARARALHNKIKEVMG